MRPLFSFDVLALNLDPAVGRARMCCDAVRWRGAPTQRADARKEKQQCQRAAARRSRLRSALTKW